MGMTGRDGHQFVKAAMQAPYLAREQEKALAERWRDDRDQTALNEMTTAHLRLVIALAARFRHFGLPMNDLIQEGNVGLLEAAARFQPERDIRFSTYATWWIRASIQDYVLRNWSIVRGGTSSAQKALFFNLRRLRTKLTRGTDRPASVDIHRQIAVLIGVSAEDVAVMDARLSGFDTSLNAPLGESEGGASDRQDFLVDETPLPDERVGAAIDGARWQGWLHEAMNGLTPREARILRARRLSEDAATLEELGAALGISKERVRQIEGRAMEKLKAALAMHRRERHTSP